MTIKNTLVKKNSIYIHIFLPWGCQFLTKWLLSETHLPIIAMMIMSLRWSTRELDFKMLTFAAMRALARRVVKNENVDYLSGEFSIEPNLVLMKIKILVAVISAKVKPSEWLFEGLTVTTRVAFPLSHRYGSVYNNWNVFLSSCFLIILPCLRSPDIISRNFTEPWLWKYIYSQYKIYTCFLVWVIIVSFWSVYLLEVISSKKKCRSIICKELNK